MVSRTLKEYNERGTGDGVCVCASVQVYNTCETNIDAVLLFFND